MQASVLPGQMRHERVGEDEKRVTGKQVAAVDALPHEIGVLVGEILIHDVELVEAAIHARELQRGAADVETPGTARDPE